MKALTPNLKKGILISIPFFFFTIALIVKFNLDDIVNAMPKCYYLSNFGIYCPGCGNTRCIAALLRLDIISAFRFNPFTAGIIFLVILWYIEAFTLVFLKKRIRLIPRRYLFWIPTAVILIAFYILRMFFEFLR